MEMCEGAELMDAAAVHHSISVHLLCVSVCVCVKKHISRTAHCDKQYQRRLNCPHHITRVTGITLTKHGKIKIKKRQRRVCANDLLRSSLSGWSKILMYTMMKTTAMDKLRYNSANDISVITAAAANADDIEWVKNICCTCGCWLGAGWYWLHVVCGDKHRQSKSRTLNFR